MTFELPEARALLICALALTILASACEQRDPAKTPPTPKQQPDQAQAAGEPATAPQKTAPQPEEPANFGRGSMGLLADAALDAIKTNDAKAFGELIAPREKIIEVCPKALGNEVQQGMFNRRYDNMQKSLANALEACEKLADWSKGHKLGYEGGERWTASPGCDTGVKRYEDIDYFYKIEDKNYVIVLNNPITIDGGKTWVLDREPYCREFEQWETAQDAATTTANAILEKDADTLAKLAVPPRLIESSCPELDDNAVTENRRELGRQPARLKATRLCEKAFEGKKREIKKITLLDEPKPPNGCDKMIVNQSVVIEYKSGINMTFDVMRYQGGIHPRWYLSSVPRCKAR